MCVFFSICYNYYFYKKQMDLTVTQVVFTYLVINSQLF